MTDTPDVKQAVVRPFKDLSVSTQTVISYSNCRFNLENIFKGLPLTESTAAKLKDITSPVHGSIYQIKCAGQTRGIQSKKGVFRNQITVAIYVLDKIVTIKIFPTGKFHMTGCKHLTHQRAAMVALFKHIRDVHTDALPTITIAGERIEIILETVLVNVDFDIGFNINQTALDQLLQTNESEGFYSIFETPVHTSVNVKYDYAPPTEKSYPRVLIPLDTTSTKVTYDEVNDCPQAKKKEHYTHTFLVFNSNKVIQSGRFHDTEMAKVYIKFNDLMNKHRDKLELKLSNSKFDLTTLKGFTAHMNSWMKHGAMDALNGVN